MASVEVSFAAPQYEVDSREPSFLQCDVFLRHSRLGFLYRLVVQRTKARLVNLDHAGIRISHEIYRTVSNSILYIFVRKLTQLTGEGLASTRPPS